MNMLPFKLPAISRNAWWAGAGAAVPLLVALALYLAWFGADERFGQVAFLLFFASLVVLLAAVGAHTLGWFYRAPQVLWSLLGVFALPGALALLILAVGIILFLPGASSPALLSILLLFSVGLDFAMGLWFVIDLAGRVAEISAAAFQVAEGQVSARAAVSGQDEVAALAAAFNRAAARMQSIDVQERGGELLRRDLVAWAGEDLRTPLSVVQAILADLAGGEPHDPAYLQAQLQNAQDELNQLTAILADLEEIGALDSGRVRLALLPNSLGKLFSETMRRLAEPSRLQQVAISGEVDPGVDPVWIDPQRMSRAIYSLVIGALQRTPEGGAVFLHAWREGGAVWIEIRRSGKGYAPAELPHLLERFSKGKDTPDFSAGVTGLGLSVARCIITAHQGRISAENLPGTGARFLICLPFTPPGIGSSRSLPSTLEEF